MSRAKVNPYKKHVTASVALQYIIEAKERNMSLSTYIDWLKHKAGVTTQYDQLIADYESQGSAAGEEGE